jgi:uncharacterized membrane protein YeaQ/YmgE (transglycosylase-associated protein family)
LKCDLIAPFSAPHGAHVTPQALKKSTRTRFLLEISAIICLLVLASLGRSTATEQSDGFDLFPQNWNIYHGTLGETIKVDMEDGNPSPPSILLTQSRTITPDPPPFGGDTNSIYWSNPDTGVLTDFELDFWIKFESDVSKALITFRMQDDQNYYAALLSDTRDWYSQFFKFAGGVGASIGNRSREQGEFDQNAWAHVKLIAKGVQFLAFKDGSPLFNATDSQFTTGRKLGIGVYNGYTYGSFKVDSFHIETTERLVYTQVITTIRTVSSTQVVPVTITQVIQTIAIAAVTLTQTTQITTTEVTRVTATSYIQSYSTSTTVEVQTITQPLTKTALGGEGFLVTLIIYAVVGFAGAMAAMRSDKRGATIFAAILGPTVAGGLIAFISYFHLEPSDIFLAFLTALFGLACGVILGVLRVPSAASEDKEG